MRRTPLRRISKKHAKALREYMSLRREFMEQHPPCQLCGAQATDIHHKAKRGKNLNNVDTWMAVCRKCHNRIEDNKSWARANGLLENI